MLSSFPPNNVRNTILRTPCLASWRRETWVANVKSAQEHVNEARFQIVTKRTEIDVIPTAAKGRLGITIFNCEQGEPRVFELQSTS